MRGSDGVRARSGDGTASSSPASGTARRPACSTLTGSVSSVQPKRRASRPKWVSTVIPGMPNALPSTTLAVLRPTPGSSTRSVRRGGTSPPWSLDQGRGQLQQRLGLGPEEAERTDQPLEMRPVGCRHRLRVGVGGEQRRAGRVDPLVGGLGGQHRDHEELERVSEVELAAGVGIGLGKRPVDLPGPPDQGGVGHGGKPNRASRRRGRPSPHRPRGPPRVANHSLVVQTVICDTAASLARARPDKE